MTSEKYAKAIDLSHHLSDVANARKVSPLKGLVKYMKQPGMLSLAGGMPHPDYFPFADISGNVLLSNSYSIDNTPQSSALSWIWSLFTPKQKTQAVTVPKYPTTPGEVNLATALQYGTATGLVQLQAFIKEFTGKVYAPAYSDWTNLIQTGNTDALTRAILTLLNPGDLFLTEEWTYPSALSSAQPFGIVPVPVSMDGGGMCPDDLRKVLSEWDEKTRGAKRPHVMYTVPIGQNPSGATMGLPQKKAIYDICVEYDIIIIEDDPYYFLQFKEFQLGQQHPSSTSKHDGPSFIASLIPSYLKIDVQGRVVRLDTFSKTIAPGSRLGFFTCNPFFAEKFERQGETTTQAPCGFGQSLVTQLLLSWGHDGYIRWLHGLTAQYEDRRDYLIDCLAEEFTITKSLETKGIGKGMEVLNAYGKLCSGEKTAIVTKLFSLIPPNSGMFLWLKVPLDSIPDFQPGDERSLEMKLFEQLADAGVLFVPGSIFAADDISPPEPNSAHYRISFSNADFDALKKAMKIFAKVINDFHKQ